MTRSIRFVVLADALFYGERTDLAWIGRHRGIEVIGTFQLSQWTQLENFFETKQKLKEPIQALYVATHPNMHLAATLLAAKYGAHIFIEGPMALDPAQCLDMRVACQQRDVHLMIGRRLLLPARQYVMDVIQRGAQPEIFSSVHQSPDVDRRDLLWRLGYDCVNATYDVFRKWPSNIEAVVRTASSYVVTMRMDQRIATCIFGQADREHSIGAIASKDDTIAVAGMYATLGEASIRFVQSTKRRSFRACNPITAEIDVFMRTIRRDLSPPEPFSASHGQNVVHVLEAIQNWKPTP